MTLGADQSETQVRTMSGLAALSEDWLAVKRVARGSVHSDRARNADLRRWAQAILEIVPRPHPAELLGPTNGLKLWDYVTVPELGDPDLILRALDHLGSRLAPKTVDRMLSVLRGWTSWLIRRGVLTHDPTDSDDLHIQVPKQLNVRAFTTDDVEALLHATTLVSAKTTSAWPARDAAIIAVLAGCGLRAAELCALTIAEIDRNVERPLARIRDAAKGGRHRNVPLPRHTVTHIDAYLTERTDRATNEPGLVVKPKTSLFVRNNGQPLTPSFLYDLLNRLCRTANITAPDGAMAHALRHHYGTQLATRGVPLPVIQQLLGHASATTTAIYTRVTEATLTDALTDAGWL